MIHSTGIKIISSTESYTDDSVTTDGEFRVNNTTAINSCHRRRLRPSMGCQRLFCLSAVLTIWMTRSEALASSHRGSGLFGQRLNLPFTTRRNDGMTTTTTTCVMQQVPSSSSSSSSAAVNGYTSTAAATPADVTPVEFVAETKLPTELGQFQLRAYRVAGAPIGREPCVIYYREKPPFGGHNTDHEAVPVRIHDQCLTSEVFGSRRYVYIVFFIQ
jgi:GTP cyclohydrolase II